MGDGTYSVPVNLYKTNLDLGLAFGRATMYIKVTENGITPTGFYDYWDLDTKPWGIRSYPAEIITRYFDWQLNGTNFKITYP